MIFVRKNNLNLNKYYILVFIRSKFFDQDKNRGFIISYCERIDKKCENKRYTICDSNFLINFLNFCTSFKRQLNFREFFKIFKHFLRLVCDCCQEDKFFCSKLVYDNEFNLTIYRKILFLTKLEKRIAFYYINENKKKLKSEYEKHLNYKSVDKKKLKELKVIADLYTKQKIKREIEIADLSLFLVALEDMRENIEHKFLIITDDVSLYDFINHQKDSGAIELSGMKYTIFNIIPITAVTYLTTIFICCKFQKIQEFDEFLFRKELMIDNERMRIYKCMAHYKWLQRVYPKAKGEKDLIGKRRAEA